MPAKYDVADLIYDTVRLYTMRLEGKPIEFELQMDKNVPSELIGDELKLKQILNSLLANATKYTKSGKVILSISAGFIGDDQVTLVIKVRDTGQGMTGEKLKKLFQKHTRSYTETTCTNGKGLGMSITRNLIKMMNGTISVASEPGKGTEFTVGLPQGAHP